MFFTDGVAGILHILKTKLITSLNATEAANKLCRMKLHAVQHCRAHRQEHNNELLLIISSMLCITLILIIKYSFYSTL